MTTDGKDTRKEGSRAGLTARGVPGGVRRAACLRSGHCFVARKASGPVRMMLLILDDAASITFADERPAARPMPDDRSIRNNPDYAYTGLAWQANELENPRNRRKKQLIYIHLFINNQSNRNDILFM